MLHASDVVRLDLVANCHLHFDYAGGNPTFPAAADLRAPRRARSGAHP